MKHRSLLSSQQPPSIGRSEKEVHNWRWSAAISESASSTAWCRLLYRWSLDLAFPLSSGELQLLGKEGRSYSSTRRRRVNNEGREGQTYYIRLSKIRRGRESRGVVEKECTNFSWRRWIKVRMLVISNDCWRARDFQWMGIPVIGLQECLSLWM